MAKMRYARNVQVVEAFLSGLTQAAIARQHRISQPMVCRILANYGVDRRDGGASRRARIRQNYNGPCQDDRSMNLRA